MTAVRLSPSSSDARLPQATTGDAAAFTALVRRHQPQVYRWALALCGDEDEAEDITQETFVRVHRKLSGFRGEGSFEGWLYRITRRVLLRQRRQRQRRSANAPRLLAADPSSPAVYITDPGARIDARRAVALVGEIAATLPLRQREIFVLCDLEGLTPTQVAELTGARAVTVRANLFKARASIRRTLLATHPAFTDFSERSS